MKRCLTLLILLSVMQVSAQETIGYDRGSYSVSLLSGFPFGNYRDNYISSIDPKATFGIALSYLKNPYTKRRSNSKVFVGGEFGYQGQKQKDFINQYGGTFYVSYSQFWLNLLTKYRPILWSSRINPFVDVSAGPQLFSSRIMERVSEEEVYKVDGFSSVAMSFSAGAGAGILISKEGQPARYLDLGVYYVGVSPLKVMDRGSILINTNAEVFFEKKSVSPDQIQVRLSFTGFL